jgi:hypothetical protein
MIDIAARATRGVKLPTRQATRAYIIQLFKKNLTNLRNRINVRTMKTVLLYFPLIKLSRIERRGLSLLPVMHGKPETRMPTSG